MMLDSPHTSVPMLMRGNTPPTTRSPPITSDRKPTHCNIAMLQICRAHFPRVLLPPPAAPTRPPHRDDGPPIRLRKPAHQPPEPSPLQLLVARRRRGPKDTPCCTPETAAAREPATPETAQPVHHPQRRTTAPARRSCPASRRAAPSGPPQHILEPPSRLVVAIQPLVHEFLRPRPPLQPVRQHRYVEGKRAPSLRHRVCVCASLALSLAKE